MKGVFWGAAIGFSAPYIMEASFNINIKNKGLWGLGGALLGAGIGYGIGESLYPGSDIGDLYLSNSSKNFFANFKAFYTGLVGQPGTLVGPPDKFGHYAFAPNVVGKLDFSKISLKWTKILPKWNIEPRRPDGPTSVGFIWRTMLIFNPPVIPAYFLLREILQLPLPYFRR